MKTNNFLRKRNARIRKRREDKGKLSDNTIDNKKFKHQKILQKKIERRAAKKALKAEKMDVDSD